MFTKSSLIQPKSDILIFFSKTALTIFQVFGLNLVLNMTFNLKKPIAQKKICNLEIFELETIKKLPKLRFLAIFWALHRQFSLILHVMIGGHYVQLFSYNSLVQCMYSCFLENKFHPRVLMNRDFDLMLLKYSDLYQICLGIICLVNNILPSSIFT